MSRIGMGAQSGHTCDESQRHMQGTASRKSERVNEARPQKSSRQKLPVTLCTSRGRGSADKHSERFSPVTVPSSRATSRPYHSEWWLFSHLFFSMLCLRLSKNCSAFFCLLVRSVSLSLPPPLSLSFNIAAIDVSNWASCFASSFAACEAFKASLSASAPSLARLFTSWTFWFHLFGAVWSWRLRGPASLFRRRPSRGLGRVSPVRPSRNRLPEEFIVDENQSRANASNALFFCQLYHLVCM